MQMYSLILLMNLYLNLSLFLKLSEIMMSFMILFTMEMLNFLKIILQCIQKELLIDFQNNEEMQYLECAWDIVNKGIESVEENGSEILSKYGFQMKFDLSESFPLFTTVDVDISEAIATAKENCSQTELKLLYPYSTNLYIEKEYLNMHICIPSCSINQISQIVANCCLSFCILSYKQKLQAKEAIFYFEKIFLNVEEKEDLKHKSQKLPTPFPRIKINEDEIQFI